MAARRQAASALATIIGPMAAGMIFERVRTASPFLAGAAMFALAEATIVVAVRLQPRLHRSPREADSATRSLM